MTDHYAEYRDAVNWSLINYQYIEQVLKECMGRSYYIINLLLKGVIPFKMSIEDVADAPLGALIKRFAQVCDDDDLIRALSGIVKARNEVAHRAFLVQVEEVSPGGAKHRATGKLQAQNEKLKALLYRLFDYLKSLDIKVKNLSDSGRGT
jgi:hypothetical protein